MKKILIIQTAFLGDVVLATALLEKLHQHYPEAKIDLLVRKGNEPLLDGHPFLNEALIWDKKQSKYSGLFTLLRKIRFEKYDLILNLQRYFSTGFLTVFSGAKKTVGFSKNPLSVFFSKRFSHRFGDSQKPVHEVERNLQLISEITDNQFVRPRLYLPKDLPENFYPTEKYITISPGSIWLTKQFPVEKWVAFLDRVGEGYLVFLMGGNGEKQVCEAIKKATKYENIRIKAGDFTLLESATLMRGAVMNFTNDSAPTHLCSAVNAPVTTIFCSTLPSFGFTPISDDSLSVETDLNLPCRPCGLHGKKACPEGHFKCADISVERILSRLP